MTSYPTPWEKAGKTLTAIRQLGRIQNCLRLNLQSCLFNGITAPRHATLTSDPRRTHIAPMFDSVTFRLTRFQSASFGKIVQRFHVQKFKVGTGDGTLNRAEPSPP
jgi:hypothetical protein